MMHGHTYIKREIIVAFPWKEKWPSGRYWYVFALPVMPVFFVIEEVMGNTVDTADNISPWYHFQLKYDDSPFLGSFEKIAKRKYYLHYICPCVRMEHLGSHLTYFNEI